MKLSILPTFNMKPNAEELAYKHAPLYNGKNKTADFVLNRTFYILAFLIPLFTMLFLMKHFGYAPFGDRCMYVLDGAYINLPILNGLIHDIREGSFHLFTLKGSMGSEFYSSIAYYLSSPFTLICLFFSQETAVILLSLFSVLRISLSGPFFLYFLTHRKLERAGSPYDPMMLILSLGYSLSSYALVQYNDFMFLDHFMLFPLLLLFLEEFMVSGKWKKLAFLNAFLLFSNFYLGIILNLFLVLYYFLKSNNSITDDIYRFGKLILAFLFSCALSAITVVPGICAFVENCHVTYMNLFTGNLQGDYYAFFLRHMFYTLPSFYQVECCGINLYFGLFAFLLAFLYFFCKHFSLQKRGKNLLFLTILVLSFCSMQFSYFFHLFTINDTYYCIFSFVYITFLLLLGSEVLPHIRTISLPRILVAVCLPVGLSILSLNLVSLSPDYNSVYYTLCIILIYGILLLLYRIGSIKRDSFISIVLCICCLELFANAFQVSFNISKENTAMKDVIIRNSVTYDTSDAFSREEMVDFPEYAYQLNLNSRFHFNRMSKDSQPDFIYTPLQDSLNSVRYLYRNTESSFRLNSLQYQKLTTADGYDVYENKMAFPAAFALSGSPDQDQIDMSTFITEQNSIATSLGSEHPIYNETHPDNVSLTLPKGSNISILNLGHHVFSIQKPENSDASLSVNPTLHFTPTESGCLYLIVHGSPVLFGDVTAGETYAYSFSAELSDVDDTIVWVQFCYYDDVAHENLCQHIYENACAISYNGLSGFLIHADVAEDSLIVTSLPYDLGMKLAQNTPADVTLVSYQNKLALRVPAGVHTITLNYTYFPFVFGCFLTFFSLVLCISVARLTTLKTKTQHLYHKTACLCYTYTKKVICFVSENQIYFLAFFIPLGFYITIMIFCGCEPFGIYSIFNGDGPSITLPTMYHISDLLKNGLYAHSWYGGNGFNTSDFIQFSVMELLYYFVPTDKLILFTTLLVVFAMCLCGPSIVFYLTHRLTGKRAYKKDYRLLIPAMCYAFCNYALLMINNTAWYYALILFPLILLGMDYLMLKRKSRYYIIALALSLLIQYYLTMFICFFLVIHFFTYRFESIKDFIKKGIRFAVASISTGLLSFYSLYYALSGMSGNTYAKEDSVFPSSYLFNGFEYIFNRLSIFADGFIISWEDGNVNLYFGILVLILLAVFLLQRNSLREKLRFLIPYVIFFLALNHSVLNYVFNGFHYQHGVPNRFAFLVVISAAFMSYDAIRILQKTPRRKVILGSIGIFALFTVSYVVTSSDTRNVTAYIGTMVCLLLYTILLCRPFPKKLPHKRLGKLLVALFVLELFVNAAYQTSIQTGTSYYLMHMASASSFVNQDYGMENSLDHIAIYSPDIENLSYVNKLKTNMQFSTMSTESQINLASYFGCEATSNIIRSANTQTPLGYALGNTRYLLLFSKAYTSNIQDIKFHRPVALQDNTIIFENERYFPFAYYLPQSVSSLMNRTLVHQAFWNELTRIVLKTENMLQYATMIQNCTQNEVSKYPEENYFTAHKVETDNNSYYNLDIHMTIPRDGSVYVKRADFQYVGDHTAGEKINFVMDGRSINSNIKTKDETGDLLMFVLDDDLVTELNEKINEHPFRVTSFTNDSIRGTIDMPEDGYVNFTMPYDERWHVLVDGKETKLESLGNGFATIHAKKGSHEISLDYVDNRRPPVVLITILAWIGLFAACRIKDNVKKRRNKSDV